MSGRLFRIAALVAAVFLFVSPLARAQLAAPSPSSDALAAARELITTMHMADQFKAMMPTILKSLKAAIVQNRSDVDRDYDAMTPVLLDGFQARVGELSEAVTIIYASNFSVEDLQALNAFYKTPTGQRLLQKTPSVLTQTMAAGQKFGQSVAADLRQRMLDELRKKGHDL